MASETIAATNAMKTATPSPARNALMRTSPCGAISLCTGVACLPASALLRRRALEEVDEVRPILAVWHLLQRHLRARRHHLRPFGEEAVHSLLAPDEPAPAEGRRVGIARHRAGGRGLRARRGPPPGGRPRGRRPRRRRGRRRGRGLPGTPGTTG